MILGDVSPSLVAMDTSRCLKLVLPFLDAVELLRAAACRKDIQSLTQQPELWEALCRSYTADCWETQRGDQVEAPEREADESGRQYFERLYERYIYFRDKDVICCDKCRDWTSIEDDALECEDCCGKWCQNCAEPAPSKFFVPCSECPDFSKSHCHECFAEGKTMHCECSGTDSWHSCCGQHGYNCEKCDATLCEGCGPHHDCPNQNDEDEDEDGDESDD